MYLSFQLSKRLETSSWQQRPILCSDLGNIFEYRRSNAIWLVTVKGSKSCDTISFVKLIYDLCYCY